MEPVTLVVIGLDEEAGVRRLGEFFREEPWCRERMKLLFVDSGSSDGSVEAAGSWAHRIVSAGENRWTAARAREAGWREVGRGWFFFLDADMVPSADFLRLVVERASQGAGTDGLVGWRRDLWEEGRDRVVRFGTPGERVRQFGGALVLHAESLRAAGGWFGPMPSREELELNVRLHAAGHGVKFVNVHMCDHHDAKRRRVLARWARALTAPTTERDHRLGPALVFQRALRQGHLRALFWCQRESLLAIPLVLCAFGLAAGLLAGHPLLALACAGILWLSRRGLRGAAFVLQAGLGRGLAERVLGEQARP